MPYDEQPPIKRSLPLAYPRRLMESPFAAGKFGSAQRLKTLLLQRERWFVDVGFRTVITSVSAIPLVTNHTL